MHPYLGLQKRNFWSKYVSDAPWRSLNLNDQPKFKLQRMDRIATAGSCFAQHISRHMKKAGLSPYIAEPAHALISEFSEHAESYEMFSARYGNVYTARQCLELFQQAFHISPIIYDFTENNGRWFDLLRPNVQKDGFSSLHEAQADREYHLSCVKNMFEQTNIFIFTLGLTESWYNTELGHTYPACPGTARGEYKPDLHKFHNFTCSEITTDLKSLIHGLQSVNPELKIILTVSPVPLVATYTNDNVLIASAYSKSVLRTAAGEISSLFSHVAYFPSYEIISHTASFGQYLAGDLREVTERGVTHVMDCFLTSFYGAAICSNTEIEATQATARTTETPEPPPECDEIFNSI
jgi:hypothetical protein